MDYRKIGISALETSVIGLGALHFGVFCNQEETKTIVRHALELGVNFIDTAPLYGNGQSESFLKNALKGLRDKVILSTKLGLEPVTKTDGTFGVEVALLKKTYIRKSIEKSLRALGTDYIDLYQLHAFDWETPVEETIYELESLIQEGKVRFIGGSNYSPQELEIAISTIGQNEFHPFSALQCHYNLIERRARQQLLPACKTHKIGIICNRALARGILTAKYKYQQPFPSGSRAASSYRVRRWLSKAILELVSKLEDFAVKRGRSAAELAIAWLLQHPEVSVVLLGIRNIEQLNQCHRAVNWLLTQEELSEIDAIIISDDLMLQVNSLPETFLEK